MDHSIVETTRGLSSSLAPTGDGVPGKAFYSGTGGNAHPFDRHLRDLVEGVSRVLEPVVRQTPGRAEGLTASLAAVASAPPATLSFERAMPDDVSLARLTVECTMDVVAGAVVDGLVSHRLTLGEVGVPGNGSQLISL